MKSLKGSLRHKLGLAALGVFLVLAAFVIVAPGPLRSYFTYPLYLFSPRFAQWQLDRASNQASPFSIRLRADERFVMLSAAGKLNQQYSSTKPVLVLLEKIGYGKPFPMERSAVIEVYGLVRTAEDATAVREIASKQRFSFPVEFDIKVDKDMVAKWESQQFGAASGAAPRR